MTAFKGVTDYGCCCLIVPYLDLVNPETRNVNSLQLDNNLYHEIPKGVKNGIQNGLTLLLDVESFDHAYFTRSAKGFRIALTNAMDKPVINLGGQYIAPGKLNMNLCFNEILVNQGSHLNFINETNYESLHPNTETNIKVNTRIIGEFWT